jgi:membrane protein YdbS with pleckstrin-like domain
MTGRHRGGSIWPWAVVTTIFVAFFLHRQSLRYTLSDATLSLSSWWGLGQPEVITLSRVDKVEIVNSFAMRMVNRGHVYVHSNLPSEGSITLLAQKNPESLVNELTRLSKFLDAGQDLNSPNDS